MNNKVKSISENEVDSQVVGEDFIPGEKSLAEIRRKLKLKKATAPDFFTCHAAAAEAMVKLGQVPYIRSTLDGKFVCQFEIDGTPAFTAPQESAALAMCCALHFVLNSKSVVT